MKRLALLFATFATLLIGGLSVTAVTHAVDADVQQICNAAVSNGTGSTPSVCDPNNSPDKSPLTGTEGIISQVANLIAYIAGAVAVIMVIYGGFRYVISNGDPAKVTSARQIILYSIIGLVLVVLAKVIVTFVLSMFA